ncbi:MAG: hypothetical protein PVJ09_03370 [Candidatus Woesebacteria bacterium]|jgi:hypothetical protein
MPKVICHTFLCTTVGEPKIDTSKNPADEVFTELRWLTIDQILDSEDIVITDSLRELLLEFKESISKTKKQL